MGTSAVEVACPKCGGKTWDNRATKKNPKAPDYKCQNRSCDGAIWPPKNGVPPVASAPAPAPAAPPASGTGESGYQPSLKALYKSATAFVLAEIVPLYEEKEIGLSDTAVASMTATLFIAAAKDR